MERRVRHRQPKGTETAGPLLNTTAPAPDPTGVVPRAPDSSLNAQGPLIQSAGQAFRQREKRHMHLFDQ